MYYNGRPLVPIRIVFWPSEQEMQDSTCENLYLGPLTEFYESLRKLQDELLKNRIVTHTHEIGQPLEAHAHPSIFPELLLDYGLISVTVLVPVLYKFLELWVKLKNGRRIKVKIDHIEIDMTQKTEEEFLRFFEIIMKYNEELKNAPAKKFEENVRNITDNTIAKLTSEGFSVSDNHIIKDKSGDEKSKLVEIFFKRREEKLKKGPKE